MAVGDAYATVAEYKAALGRADSWTTDAARDVTLLANLTGISRYIERRVGRFFTRDAAAVARIYMRRFGEPVDVLHTDDLVSVTTIKVDNNNDGSFGETALAAADYELHPLNAAQGPEARPFDRIIATSWGAQGSWAQDIRVQVTGVYGWPAVPQAVKDACIQLTAILRLESARATRRIPEMGEAIEASREAQDIIKGLMAMYRRSVFV